MRGLLVALALIVAVPASAIEHMTGWMHVPSSGNTACNFNGSGETQTVDGVSQAYFVSIHTSGYDALPTGTCVTNPDFYNYFRIYSPPNSTPIFDDNGGNSTAVTRVNYAITGAVFSGDDGSGPYTVTFTNPHLDEQNRYVLDFVFQRQSGSGGGGGGDDPPIIR